MGTKYQLKIREAITDFSQEEWNSLVTSGAVPFLEWEWLAALEESGSVSAGTGWSPLYFCLVADERIASVAPLYLKTSSDGEYLYDYFWAEAAMSLGRSWYPKMVGTLATTPAEGYRFLSGAGYHEAVEAALLEAAEAVCRQNRIPSLNLLWVDPAWGEFLRGKGYSPWDHFHYLWENQNFSSFDDYLALFSKNQRKNIRKEYARHFEQGITIKVVPGEEAEKEHYVKMFELFTMTNDKFVPWDARWVNEDFFLRLEKNCRNLTAFSEARRDSTGEIVAMAFLVRKGDRIWGRFWGAYEEIRDLHFAVCYYAPMEWCIQNHIRYFDPGAGSPHKIRRGFRAVQNRSWHKFFDPVLERLFRDNIRAINRREAANLATMNAELPFRENGL